MSNLDPLNIEAQESASADLRESQRITAYLDRDDLKWLMSDKRGRRFMWRLLTVTGVFRNAFSGEATNLANFKMGQQNVGVFFLEDLHQHTPGRYETMLTENRK